MYALYGRVISGLGRASLCHPSGKGSLCVPVAVMVGSRLCNYGWGQYGKRALTHYWQAFLNNVCACRNQTGRLTSRTRSDESYQLLSRWRPVIVSCVTIRLRIWLSGQPILSKMHSAGRERGSRWSSHIRAQTQSPSVRLIWKPWGRDAEQGLLLTFHQLESFSGLEVHHPQ